MKKILITCSLLGLLIWIPLTGIAATTSLSYGMMGAEVTLLQEKLRSLGYDLELSGTYDKATMAGVASFQRLNKLGVDGVAGAKTLSALSLDLSKQTASSKTSETVETTPVTLPLACDIKNTVPQLRIDAPNGKETVGAGGELLVAWTTCNVSEKALLSIQMIRVNSNNQPSSNSWIMLNSGTPNDGSETVTLPADVVSGSYALAVKVIETNTPSDTSDAPFRVTAPTSCLPPKITVSGSADIVLTKATSELLKFTITNQNASGTFCDQKMKTIDVAYVSTSGTRFHDKLSFKALSIGSPVVFDDTLGGFRFFVNQNEETVLAPGQSRTYSVSGELTNTSPNISYRGLMLGISRVEYEDGPKKILKTFVPKSIVFGNRFTIQ